MPSVSEALCPIFAPFGTHPPLAMLAAPFASEGGGILAQSRRRRSAAGMPWRVASYSAIAVVRRNPRRVGAASAAMRFANELAHSIMRGQKRKPWTPASRRSRRRPAAPGWVSRAKRAAPEGAACSMPSSAAGFRRRRKKGSETPCMPLAVCLDLQVSGTENLRPVLEFSQVSCLPVRICRHPARRISLWISGVKLGPPTG